MNSVYLANFAYPCVSYVIQRLGLPHDIERILACRGESYSASTKLNAGDIIIWERKDGPHISDATLTIGERGPITTKLRLGIHFGVYEGDGMVSDVTFDGDTYYPRIRLMGLHHHPTPKEILRKETLTA